MPLPPHPCSLPLRVALSDVFLTQLPPILSLYRWPAHSRTKAQLMCLPCPQPIAMVTAGTPAPAEYCSLVTFFPPSLSPFFLSHKKKAQVFYIHSAKSCVVHTNWCGFLLLSLSLPCPQSQHYRPVQSWAQPACSLEGGRALCFWRLSGASIACGLCPGHEHKQGF